MIINYELLARDEELLEKYILSKGFRFALIADELQYIKNSRAQRSKEAKKLGRKAVYKIGVTATGLELSPLDIWSEFHLINDSIFGYNYINFRDKFLEVDWFGSVVAHKNENYFRWRMKSFFIRRLRDMIATQMPKRVESTYFMELSPKQREDLLRKFKNLLKKIAYCNFIFSYRRIPSLSLSREIFPKPRRQSAR